MTGHDLEPSRLLHCMVPCLMQLHSTVFTLCSVVVCCPFVSCRLAQQCPLDTCRLAADPQDLLSACMQCYRCICAPICITATHHCTNILAFIVEPDSASLRWYRECNETKPKSVHFSKTLPLVGTHASTTACTPSQQSTQSCKLTTLTNFYQQTLPPPPLTTTMKLWYMVNIDNFVMVNCCRLRSAGRAE